MPRRFHPLIEERLPLIADATTWDEMDPAWGAPYGPPEEWDLVIEDADVDGPHGTVPVRIYTPAAPRSTRRACLVWMHGGAFIGGDLDMPEGHEVARGLAGRADAVVVSVDYRLAPEPAAMTGIAPGPDDVRFPVPLDDVCAAFGWAREVADDLGVRPDRIAIGGASAGANLAAGASLRLRDEGTPPWQTLLAYPLAHPLLPEATPEMAEAIAAMPTCLRFEDDTVRVLNENYLGGPLDPAPPYAFPALADLTGLAPVFIENCEFDDLRRSGEPFAQQLRDAGVDVELVTCAGVPHGHLNQVGLPPALETMDRMAARLRR